MTQQALLLRTHTCDDVTQVDRGSRVTLNGWVHKVRNLGSLIFVDLRDRWGITQAVFDLKYTPEAVYEVAKNLGLEDVIAITGLVALRESPNPVMRTGLIEVQVSDIHTLSKARATPFPVSDDVLVNEELRLQYRYLDMRKGAIISNLISRHTAMQITRRYLSENDFIEVTTPILGKSTPEGARDYLVPSRIHPGSFYALPQSPQMFKQLLMIGGLDRYFQIAACFRDEDLRADRQPEFHQIDVEMSFATSDALFPIIEGLLAAVFMEIKGIELVRPFPRMTYSEAMDQYGCDKPDRRFGMLLVDLSDLAAQTDFSLFHDTIHSGGVVRGLVVQNGAHMSRKQIEEYEAFTSQFGFKGLSWVKYQKEKRNLQGSIAKFIHLDQEERWIERLAMEEGDLAFVLMGTKKKVLQALDHLRRRLGKDLGLIQEGTFSPLWVVDFPLFNWNEEEGSVECEHHPFTSPHLADIDLVEKEPLRVRSSSYDLVLNGYEIGSGSQRIHDPKLQEMIFSILGMGKEKQREKFGFFVEALGYGTPPHLGIALGLDRIVMILVGTENIRDIIAFPKNQRAIDVMTRAPDSVEPSQLEALNLEPVIELG